MTLYEEAQEKIKDKMAFSRWLCELMELAPKGKPGGCDICPAHDKCEYGWNGFRTLLDKELSELEDRA